ncbi:tetratricopeptide repeat protein [Streptomyces sp. NPDC099088]|uniref:tetratricopeptide repeat protein n=1 Tax=Streptomyces sp. NPDC099088 TaxID=3366101 RepID=UPI0037F1D3BC
MSKQIEKLRVSLREAHLRSGQMSTREISKRCHGAVSHTTVSQVLKCASLPSWRSLEPVATVLGANVEGLRQLWLAAKEGDGTTTSPPSSNGARNYSYRLEPETAGAINLARIYANNKDFEKAKDLLIAQVGTSSQPDVNLLSYLCAIYWYRYPEVQEKYKEFAETYRDFGDPDELDTPEGAYWFARSLLDHDKPGRALIFAQRALTSAPNDAFYIKLHGEILLALGRYSEAEKELTAAHEMHPRLDFWFSNLAKLLKLTRNFTKLEHYMREEYENASPENRLECVHEYAECLMLCNKPTEAVDLISNSIQAIENIMSKVAAYVTLSRALCQLGRFEDARDALRKSGLYEAERELQLEFAGTFAREGRVSEAEVRLSKLYEGG